MQLTINGESRGIDGATTIRDLLVLFELNERIVVVERNGEIVPRGSYAEMAIEEGDNLEIVQMSAGG